MLLNQASQYFCSFGVLESSGFLMWDICSNGTVRIVNNSVQSVVDVAYSVQELFGKPPKQTPQCVGRLSVDLLKKYDDLSSCFLLVLQKLLVYISYKRILPTESLQLYHSEVSATVTVGNNWDSDMSKCRLFILALSQMAFFSVCVVV